MINDKYYSTTEVARLLGISRIAVFKKIKQGKIKAEKIGRNYIVGKNQVPVLMSNMQKIQKFCQQNDIDYMGVFGSYARGEMKPDSDIDILVDFKENKSLMDIGGVQYDLQQELGRKVDLISRKNIKPEIKKYIYNDLRVLYEKG